MKNPAVPVLLGTLILNPIAYAQDSIQLAQEAIQIEIDSAPVEIEIDEPGAPAAPETAPPQTAQIPEPEPVPVPEEAPLGGFGTVGITIGVLVAGALAALGGGGGSGGGGSDTTTSHSP